MNDDDELIATYNGLPVVLTTVDIDINNQIDANQITLSIFDQLDWVGPEDIEPMARVDDHGFGDGHYVVVGRDKEDGALVRSATYAAENAVSEKQRTRALEWQALPLIVLADCDE